MITGRRFHVTTEIGDDSLVVTTAQIEETMLGEEVGPRREVRVVGAFDSDLRIMELRIDRFTDDWPDQRDESVRFVELEGTRPGDAYEARVRELLAAVNCPALVPMLAQVGATALRCFRMGAFDKRSKRIRPTSRPPSFAQT